MAPALSPQLHYRTLDQLNMHAAGLEYFPYMVTLVGSPPNAAIFLFTHRNAARSDEKRHVSSKD
jgi:hypothetical protein